ncbi:MAG: hypothetical protein GY725_18770 [bacterium]|nr:hypothetical protein [bacterium]
MSFSIEELNGKKVAELRDLAAEIEHDALKGFRSMRKGELVAALANARGSSASTADTPVTPAQATSSSPARKSARKLAPAGGRRSLGVRRLQTRGLHRSQIKEMIRQLKLERSDASEAKDPRRLRTVRRQLHHLKRSARAAPPLE